MAEFGVLTRSRRRLSVDSDATPATPTKKDNLLSQVVVEENETELSPSQIMSKKALIESKVLTANVMDSPSRNLRSRRASTTSPESNIVTRRSVSKKLIDLTPAENTPNDKTVNKSLKKVQSLTTVDSPKPRKNTKSVSENEITTATVKRRSRRLSGELNVVQEDPIQEEIQEIVKPMTLRRGKRLSVLPTQPTLPEENEELESNENINISSETASNNIENKANFSNGVSIESNQDSDTHNDSVKLNKSLKINEEKSLSHSPDSVSKSYTEEKNNSLSSSAASAQSPSKTNKSISLVEPPKTRSRSSISFTELSDEATTKRTRQNSIGNKSLSPMPNKTARVSKLNKSLSAMDSTINISFDKNNRIDEQHGTNLKGVESPTLRKSSKSNLTDLVKGCNIVLPQIKNDCITSTPKLSLQPKDNKLEPVNLDKSLAKDNINENSFIDLQTSVFNESTKRKSSLSKSTNNSYHKDISKTEASRNTSSTAYNKSDSVKNNSSKLQKSFNKSGVKDILETTEHKKSDSLAKNNSSKSLEKSLSKTNKSNNEDSISISDSEDEEGSINMQFLDSASDAGMDYESGDSKGENTEEDNENEIIDNGISLDSDNSADLTDDTYEKDSFLCSSNEDDEQLLSGTGDDLSDGDNELTQSRESKEKFNKKQEKLQKLASSEMYQARHSKSPNVSIAKDTSIRDKSLNKSKTKDINNTSIIKHDSLENNEGESESSLTEDDSEKNDFDESLTVEKAKHFKSPNVSIAKDNTSIRDKSLNKSKNKETNNTSIKKHDSLVNNEGESESSLTEDDGEKNDFDKSLTAEKAKHSKSPNVSVSKEKSLNKSNNTETSRISINNGLENEGSESESSLSEGDDVIALKKLFDEKLAGLAKYNEPNTDSSSDSEHSSGKEADKSRTLEKSSSNNTIEESGDTNKSINVSKNKSMNISNNEIANASNISISPRKSKSPRRSFSNEDFENASIALDGLEKSISEGLPKSSKKSINDSRAKNVSIDETKLKANNSMKSPKNQSNEKLKLSSCNDSITSSPNISKLFQENSDTSINTSGINLSKKRTGEDANTSATNTCKKMKITNGVSSPSVKDKADNLGKSNSSITNGHEEDSNVPTKRQEIKASAVGKLRVEEFNRSIERAKKKKTSESEASLDIAGPFRVEKCAKENPSRPITASGSGCTTQFRVKVAKHHPKRVLAVDNGQNDPGAPVNFKEAVFGRATRDGVAAQSLTKINQKYNALKRRNFVR